ncbi:SusC/RagA family TonB-linked outer membrane protein [Rhodocytophaga aerolata]|uniref:SusC/RagA family TonB-linked outer membrane protein n=2 Tax=Rhodocytophaga aerolata TaxID=455078 RepID=A0ABT8RGF7_9BACT|nr:SusC/RagA family TonB-linked outer membrane protein [Rhodocytophaga aerolata]MDO1450233.1 SusC/RagA family TonB-linked outer membrane protein [Rhodocytophaga aerolata]
MKKTPRYWVLFVLLLHGVSGQIHAQTIAYAANKGQEGNKQTLYLSDLLEELTEAYQVSFVFETKLVKSKTIELERNDKTTVDDVLDRVLPQLNLKYKKIKGNTYVISPKEESAGTTLEKIEREVNLTESTIGNQDNLVQNNYLSTFQTPVLRTLSTPVFAVRGKVRADNGEELPGVNVVVKGTSIGTTTNVTGDYTLNTPDGNGTLVFSYIGYTTSEVPINNQSVIDVTLQPDVKSLSEVVVVGYGTQQKRDITGAVASVSAKNIKDLPVASIQEGLAAQVAGVQVQQTTGAPGRGLTVRVRGTGSISAANSPLYVVDGYPLGTQNISLINPNDIESIEVLKDASAAAIYGSRGANGVVLITTKKGKPGRTSIQFDYFTGLQQPERVINMLNAAEFAEHSKEAFNAAWIDRGGSASDPNSARPDGQRLRYPDQFENPASLGKGTDWQREVFRTAPMHNYQVTASGGGEKSRFLLSAGYFNQKGIVIGSDFKRFTARANVEANLSDKLIVGLNMAPSYALENRVNTDGHWASDGVINGALAIIPSIPVYNPDGSYASQVNFGFGTPGIPSPVAIAREIDNPITTFRNLGNVYAELEIIKNLRLRTTLGADINLDRNNYYRPSNVPANQQPAPTIATGRSETSQEINWLNENTLTYSTTFNERHALDALVGFTAQKNLYERNNLSATNFPNDLVRTLNAGTITGGQSFQDEWSLVSYLGRINYRFADKYLLTATIRRDGSSRFGANNKYGVFPSASIGWRISQEGFMQNVNFISDLKLRISYGLTGNNTIPNYGAIGLLGADNYSLGAGTSTLVNGLAQTTISNPDLTWERSNQLDIGLEWGLFEDRLFFTADYYDKNTYDLLLNVPVPTSTGFSTALQNIGKVNNKGFEFAINSRNLTGAFTWTTNFNISFNRNKVLALGPQGDPIRSGSGIGDTHITEVGQPLGNFFGYIQEGIFLDQADLDASAKFSDARPGDVKYTDIDGDGLITPNDRTRIGNNQPDFIYGLTNTLIFKNFDLNVILQGVQGADILNLSLRFLENLEGNQNQRSTVLDRWRSPEQPGNGRVPRSNSRTTGNNNQVSTRWIEEGSFLRIRNITLGYNVPKEVASKIFLQSARVYAGIQNAYTFTSYGGYNPEVNLGGDQALTPGTDYGGYPLPRTFTLGLNLGF